MFKPSRVEVTVRPTHLMASTIIGYARVVIDKEILLKEITVFRCDEQLMIVLPKEPVAMCPQDMDLDTLNKIIWQLQDVIEEYILKYYREKSRKTV